MHYKVCNNILIEKHRPEGARKSLIINVLACSPWHVILYTHIQPKHICLVCNISEIPIWSMCPAKAMP